MTQTMDLNKMGLAPMSELEIKETDGGSWWSALAALVAAPEIAAGLAIIGAAELLQSAVQGVAAGYKLARIPN